MEWKRQPKDGPMAHEIAAYAQRPRDSVRNLVANGHHAVITWTNMRRSWEYWWRDDRTTEWIKVASCPSAAEAKHHAVVKDSELAAMAKVRALPADTALTVTAEWKPPYHGSAPIKVPCSSPSTGEALTGILKRLGMDVHTEVAKAL